jgi:hypothetical protein
LVMNNKVSLAASVMCGLTLGALIVAAITGGL